MVSVDYGNWTVGCGQNTNNGVGRATGHAPFARKVEGQPEEGEEEVVSVSWSSLFPLMSCREGVCLFGGADKVQLQLHKVKFIHGACCLNVMHDKVATD